MGVSEARAWWEKGNKINKSNGCEGLGEGVVRSYSLTGYSFSFAR